MHNNSKNIVSKQSIPSGILSVGHEFYDYLGLINFHKLPTKQTTSVLDLRKLYLERNGNLSKVTAKTW